MKPLDLNLLRVLEAMLLHGSVSAAARAAGVSQPGMSLALRRLRVHFGDELFVRQGSAMIPTALAERLREPILRTLATIQQEIAPASAFDPTRSHRCFTVNLSDLGDLVFLPDLVARLKVAAPGVSVRSVVVEPTDLVAALGDGSIDLAIGHLTDVDTNNLFEQTLFAQGFGCLVRNGHPSIGDTLSLEEYLAADHLVVTQDGRSQAVYENTVRERGLQRRIALRSPHFMSVPLLVSRSDMITVVPQAVGTIYARLLNLRLLPLPFAVPAVELKQFWHRRAHADPEVMWLRKLIADIYLGRDPTRSTASSFWSAFLIREDRARGSTIDPPE